MMRFLSADGVIWTQESRARADWWQMTTANGRHVWRRDAASGAEFFPWNGGRFTTFAAAVEAAQS